MLARILIAFGAALLGLLGTIHIITTFFTNKLDPREPATIAAMKATGLVLGGRTSLWNAWVGLNAILGLFLLLFAVTYLLLGTRHMSLLHDSPTLAWLPVVGGQHIWPSPAGTFFAAHSLVSPLLQRVSWRPHLG